MRAEYLKDMEEALQALSKALESIDAAKDHGLNIHSSIGNRILTAQLVVADALTYGIEEREKMVQAEMKLPPMNTQINYMYRDADNYKVHNECVIPGILSEEQKRSIFGCLEDGINFIPSLVGMPEVKFDKYDPDADHEWFELDEDAFEPTNKKPTIPISADKLVEAFQKCSGRWSQLYYSRVIHGPSYNKSQEALTKKFSPHYAIVNADPDGTALTVREFSNWEEYRQSLSLMHCVFLDRNEAINFCKNFCAAMDVAFIEPEVKKELDRQIQSAISTTGKDSSTKNNPTPEQHR